jgi:hypothetical protein
VRRWSLWVRRGEAALHLLCDEMETLMPAVIEFGGYVPVKPRTVVEKRIALFEEHEEKYER